MKKLLAMGTAAACLGAVLATSAPALAEDVLYIPSLSYRTGPFAGGGIPNANGFADYLNMLNERDGGIGGVKIVVEECETGYNSKKGVECYESTKGKGALVYNPLSTGITLQLVPKAPVDQIPVLSMGYGLSATAIGEKFPWGFNYPTTYWNQLSSILKYADSKGGLKGKKVGFIYLDVGYGKEPIPLLDKLATKMGFSVTKYPVGVKEMQSQSSHWLKIRKDRPDWIIMWGWGAMNSTAVKEAAKIRFPLDHFIGNWWSGAHADMRPVGATAKGYMAANFSGIGTSFPAVQDVIKYVVDKGKSQVKSKDLVGDVLYNRGLFNAVVVSEAIRAAQKATGKKAITGADMRVGLETFKLTAERLKELGLEGFTAPITASCKDHEGAGPVFIQQWDGKDWKRVSDLIPPMNDVVRPLLEEAAAKYIADKPGWKTQTCK
jgi:branched-chain amino acid transport system substrate-binding protein